MESSSKIPWLANGKMITLEMVKSYSESIVDLHNIAYGHIRRGYNNVVIPSRGACPIWMNSGLYRTMKTKHECSQLSSPEDRYEWNRIETMEARSGSIWMPFTAQTGDQQEDLNTYQIRLNWCKILNSVINNHDDLNSRVYNVVTDMLGKHYGHTRSRVIKGSPALIIDTAISGKAAVEISEALESIGFSNYKVILAVDAMGSRLKKEYKSILLGEKRDKFDLVYFDSLFTEDQGPALTNVFGVIYPNLTKALRERFSDSSIATGSLHMENGRDVLCAKDWRRLQDYLSQRSSANHGIVDKSQFQCSDCAAMGGSYNTVHAILGTLFVHFAKEKLAAHEDNDEIRSHISDCFLDQQIRDLNQAISSFQFEQTSTTLELFKRTSPLQVKTEDSVSSSHVIKCNINPDDIDKILHRVARNEAEFRDHYVSH